MKKIVFAILAFVAISAPASAERQPGVLLTALPPITFSAPEPLGKEWALYSGVVPANGIASYAYRKIAPQKDWRYNASYRLQTIFKVAEKGNYAIVGEIRDGKGCRIDLDLEGTTILRATPGADTWKSTVAELEPGEYELTGFVGCRDPRVYAYDGTPVDWWTLVWRLEKDGKPLPIGNLFSVETPSATAAPTAVKIAPGAGKKIGADLAAGNKPGWLASAYVPRSNSYWSTDALRRLDESDPIYSLAVAPAGMSVMTAAPSKSFDAAAKAAGHPSAAPAWTLAGTLVVRDDQAGPTILAMGWRGGGDDKCRAALFVNAELQPSMIQFTDDPDKGFTVAAIPVIPGSGIFHAYLGELAAGTYDVRWIATCGRQQSLVPMIKRPGDPAIRPMNDSDIVVPKS